MTPATRSVRVFAVYLGLLAVSLLFVPNLLLQAFGLPPTHDRGVDSGRRDATALLGVYYWTAAATELTPFFRASVLCRLTVPLFFLIFVAAGWARWPLILFGVIDALGDAWTWQALGRDSSAA